MYIPQDLKNIVLDYVVELNNFPKRMSELCGHLFKTKYLSIVMQKFLEELNAPPHCGLEELERLSDNCFKNINSLLPVAGEAQSSFFLISLNPNKSTE